MKLVTIEAMFPELKGPHIYKTGRGCASTARAAAARAFSDLLKQNKGKRIRMIKATIFIVEVAEEVKVA